MKTRHKHADILIAIADGKEVEYSRTGCSRWFPLYLDGEISPITDAELIWRIKPEVKPDVVMKFQATSYGDRVLRGRNEWKVNNLKLTFDGETGNLKSAEVLE